MKSKTPGIFILVVLLSFIPMVLKAQESSCNYFCCPTDRTPLGIMMSHIHKKGEWMASYRFMNTNSNDNLSGKTKIGDDIIYQNYLMSPKNMSMNMHMLMLMYGLSNRITIMAMMNYNLMSMNMSMLPGTMHMHGSGTETSMSSTSSGIGDTKINILYGLVNKERHHILVSAGVSLPTGSISKKGDQKSMYQGARLPYVMQTGTGTVDFSPGITYLLERKSFTWGTQATSVIRSNYNSLGYNNGNDLTLNSWLAYQWSKWCSNALRIEGNTSGKIKGRDATMYSVMEPSANTGNYGGQKLTTFLGLNFYIRNGILNNNRLAIEYGIPVYRFVNGIQMKAGNTLCVGWQVKF